MINEDIFEEMQDLYEQAFAYAKVACDNFTLDSIAPTFPSDGKLNEFLNAFSAIIAADPVKFLWASNHMRYIIHFMFPNLTDEERTTIEVMQAYSSVIQDGRRNDSQSEARRKFAALRWNQSHEAMLQFEGKLTAVQLALLDSSFGNPDSDVDVF